MQTLTTNKLLSTLISEDISLFIKHFPNVKINWNSIKWVMWDECSKEWQSQFKKTLKNKEHPNFYYPRESTVVFSELGIKNEYIRLHEFGHMIHHQLLDYKRFVFKRDYEVTMPLYWGIESFEGKKLDHTERFADVFTDTMLRFRYPNCIMFDYNRKMIRILREC